MNRTVAVITTAMQIERSNRVNIYFAGDDETTMMNFTVKSHGEGVIHGEDETGRNLIVILQNVKYLEVL